MRWISRPEFLNCQFTLANRCPPQQDAIWLIDNFEFGTGMPVVRIAHAFGDDNLTLGREACVSVHEL